MGSSYDAIVYFNRNVQNADKITPILGNYSGHPVRRCSDNQ